MLLANSFDGPYKEKKLSVLDPHGTELPHSLLQVDSSKLSFMAFVSVTQEHRTLVYKQFVKNIFNVICTDS